MNRTSLATFLVASLGFAGCRSERIESSSDRVIPTPAEIPYLGIKLPASVRDYYAYESGMQHTMLQLRFELAQGELALLEKRLPCRLGPARSGPPEHALVGTNDRAWYKPEIAKKHRSCEYHDDLRTAAFLVDIERTDRVVVYAVIASE